MSLLQFADIEVQPRERRLLRGGRAVPLGGRAFDVLLTLLEHPDRVVSKDELLERVWPGQGVEENNITVQMAALRRAIGPQHIATLPGVGYRLQVAVASPTPATVPVATPAPPPVRPRDPLFGRDADLAALGEALRTHRLVTLVGTAGIGKTRLARAYLQLRGVAPDVPATMVDLSPLPDAALLLGTVAAGLGLTPSAAAQPAVLAAALGQRPLLLVLDNCEHLEASVAALASALLAGAPGVRLLATSQVPLRLDAEQLLRVGPLALPQALHRSKIDDIAIETARRTGAVALFEARARANDPRFVLTTQNLATVVEVCRQLDGLPLAIELAASRVTLLGVEGLHQRLDQRLRLLADRHRPTVPRHRTMQAALDWSHALLSSDEQAVFRRLSVFVGGFSLAAVQALAGDERIDEWTVLDLLGQLIDRSLVVVELEGHSARAAGAPETDAVEPRYRLLETMRQYATIQLRNGGEDEALRARHARWFADFANTHGLSTAQVRSLATRWPLVLEHDNLRAALDWAAAHDGALGLTMAAALLPFWRERGHHAEAQARCEALLAHPANQQPSEARARVSIVLCAVANERNEVHRLRGLALAALADARAIGHRGHEALGHIWLAHADGAEQDWAAAERQYRLALAILRELGGPARIAETLTNIACIHIEQGQVEETPPLLTEALALYRQADNLWGLGFATSTLAEVARAQGDFMASLGWAEQALAHHRQLAHQHRLAYSLNQRATILLALGRHVEARADLVENLSLCAERGFKQFSTLALVLAAALAADLGHWPQAAILLGAMQAQSDAGGTLHDRMDRELQAATVARVQAALGGPAWEASSAAGRSLGAAQAAAAVAALPIA